MHVSPLISHPVIAALILLGTLADGRARGPGKAGPGKTLIDDGRCREDLRARRNLYFARMGKAFRDAGLRRRYSALPWYGGRHEDVPDPPERWVNRMRRLDAAIARTPRCVPPLPMKPDRAIEEGFPFILGTPPAPWPRPEQGETGASMAARLLGGQGELPSYPRPGRMGRTGLELALRPVPPRTRIAWGPGIDPVVRPAREPNALPSGDTEARRDRDLTLIRERVGPDMYRSSQVRWSSGRILGRSYVLIEHRLSDPGPGERGLIKPEAARVWVVDPRDPGRPLAVMSYPDVPSSVGRPLIWCTNRKRALELSCPGYLPDDLDRAPPECRPSEVRWLRLVNHRGAPALEIRSYTCKKHRGPAGVRYEWETMRSHRVLKPPRS